MEDFYHLCKAIINQDDLSVIKTLAPPANPWHYKQLAIACAAFYRDGDVVAYLLHQPSGDDSVTLSASVIGSAVLAKNKGTLKQLLEYLVSSGKSKELEGRSLINMLSKLGDSQDIQVVQMLFDTVGDEFDVLAGNQVLLRNATFKGPPEMVELVMKHPAFIEQAKDPENFRVDSAVTDLLGHGRVDELRQYMALPGFRECCEINKRYITQTSSAYYQTASIRYIVDELQWTVPDMALYGAAGNGACDLVAHLLGRDKEGASPHLTDPITVKTLAQAMTSAIDGGHLDIVQVLYDTYCSLADSDKMDEAADSETRPTLLTALREHRPKTDLHDFDDEYEKEIEEEGPEGDMYSWLMECRRENALHRNLGPDDIAPCLRPRDPRADADSASGTVTRELLSESLYGDSDKFKTALSSLVSSSESKESIDDTLVLAGMIGAHFRHRAIVQQLLQCAQDRQIIELPRKALTHAITGDIDLFRDILTLTVSEDSTELWPLEPGRLIVTVVALFMNTAGVTPEQQYAYIALILDHCERETLKSKVSLYMHAFNAADQHRADSVSHALIRHPLFAQHPEAVKKAFTLSAGLGWAAEVKLALEASTDRTGYEVHPRSMRHRFNYGTFRAVTDAGLMDFTGDEVFTYGNVAWYGETAGVLCTPILLGNYDEEKKAFKDPEALEKYLTQEF